MKIPSQVEKELEEFIEGFLPAGKLSAEIVKKWAYKENGAPVEAIHKFQDNSLSILEKSALQISGLNIRMSKIL